MRILIFGWRDPKHPLAGGAENSVHEHAKRWVQAGHQVTLFASSIVGLPAEELLDRVKIVRGGYQYLGVQLAGFFYYLAKRKKFDFVVDQFHGIPFFTPLYVRKSKLAIIQETAREVWFLSPLPWPLNWMVGLIGYILEPLIFLFYKGIRFMTGSASARDDLVRMGIPRKNITVVSHGVTVKNPRPRPAKEKKFTLIFLGILSRDKGVEDALRCFQILNKKGAFSAKGGPTSGWQFWVVGRPEKGTYQKFVLKLAKSLGLGQRVKFWGLVSEEKKFELLSRAHVLVNPSIREGWGLVNIEANALGTPVVAYDVPGCRDSVKNGQTGFLSRRGDYGSLASNVLKLAKGPQLYKQLASGAIAWSKNFKWEKAGRQSERLLRQIARARG